MVHAVTYWKRELATYDVLRRHMMFWEATKVTRGQELFLNAITKAMQQNISSSWIGFRDKLEPDWLCFNIKKTKVIYLCVCFNSSIFKEIFYPGKIRYIYIYIWTKVHIRGYDKESVMYIFVETELKTKERVQISNQNSATEHEDNPGKLFLLLNHMCEHINLFLIYTLLRIEQIGGDNVTWKVEPDVKFNYHTFLPSVLMQSSSFADKLVLGR